MFSKVALFTAATMAVFVAAAPSPQGGINNSCNTGPVQCCNSLFEAEDEHITDLAALLGVATGAITGQAGLNCSPITLIGLGSGAKCTTQPVCCTDNKFNGLINFGCSPVALGL
ncbi:hydrophobin [Panaeolus papilionaceus]|nr:hydrophobin [Panaeolus papilionaceus]